MLQVNFEVLTKINLTKFQMFSQYKGVIPVAQMLPTHNKKIGLVCIAVRQKKNQIVC